MAAGWSCTTWKHLLDFQTLGMEQEGDDKEGSGENVVRLRPENTPIIEHGGQRSKVAPRCPKQQGQEAKPRLKEVTGGERWGGVAETDTQHRWKSRLRTV